MNNVLIVGSGRLGKGYFGEIFFNAGWNICFLDNDKRVIDELNKDGFYSVRVHTTDDIVERTITDYKAYYCDEEYSCMKEFLNTDVMMLPLYPDDFEEAARYLSKCFATLYKINPEKKMTLICVTNKNHIITQIEDYFISNLPDEETKKWFKTNIAVRDSIVRRSTDAETSYSTNLVTTAVAPLLIQSPVYNDFSDVKWMSLCKNVEMLKDIKVFTINGPHATQAYYGYLKGLKNISEASYHPEVGKLSKDVHTEIVNAVMKEYPITIEELTELEYLPKAKYEMVDSISRVAFDPIRKVGNNDRLTGAAQICLKHELSFKAIAKAIACAFIYEDKDDKNAVLLQNEIKELGIDNAVHKYTGLEKSSPIFKCIIDSYNNLVNCELLNY